MIKLKLIDNIINNLLKDLSSLRFQLVLLAVALNIWIIKQIVCCGLNYSVGITSLGLLATAFAYFFHSKGEQAKMENQTVSTLSERDPDA